MSNMNVSRNDGDKTVTKADNLSFMAAESSWLSLITKKIRKNTSTMFYNTVIKLRNNPDLSLATY